MAWSPEPYSFKAIGTQWTISLPDGLLAAERENLERVIQERIAVFDKNYSRFRNDSLIAEMAVRAGTYELPADAQPMLDLYEKIFRLSNGSVTPLIGQVLSDAGYDASYSLREKPLSRPLAWDEVLEYRYPNLTLKQPALLDFGAAGKGYLIDLIAGILKMGGVSSFLVDAGGDMAHVDLLEKPIEIALEHPDDTDSAIGIASLCNRSLCGSAGNRRRWGRFHHIIDPHALASPQHIKALWTMASTTLEADMLATALFFMKPETLRAEFDFDYLIVQADDSISRSKGFAATLFT